MIQLALLLALSAIIVAAAVGCVIGTRRLTYWSRLERYFFGEIIVTFAWVLPEYLIALHGLLAPGRIVNHSGDSYISVGVIMGGAAANMLLIGILNSAWPGKAGLESAGLSLASAAIVLLVFCATAVGLGIGRGNGVSPAQIIAGSAVFAVFLAGLRLVYRQHTKEEPPELDLDPPFLPGRGTLIGALAMTGASVIALVYASPYFVELAVPWFQSGGDLPHEIRALLRSGLTIALGLLMAVPDFILSTLELGRKGRESPTPRLLLASAALVAFTAIAGMDHDTLWDAFASSLFASFALTVFVTALMVILLLAVPSNISARMRGLIVAGTALAGLVFSLLITGH